MYRRFNFQVIFRILLLFGTLFSFTIIFGNSNLFFNQIILGIIILLQVANLLYYVNRTNQELQKFLEAIKHNDYTVNFTSNKLGKSFKGLDQAFANIIASYKQVKIEKEAQFQFLEVIVGRINVGIISVKNNQEIVLMNEAAASLLKVPKLRNWQHLHQKVPTFTNVVETLKDGGKKLLEIKTTKETRQLSVNVTPLYLLDEPYMVVTMQDINTEIEQKELEAWNKLIRILTHEIMNSLTPVASLTETMLMLMENETGSIKKNQEISNEQLADIHFSLNTILKRSEGMLHFVEDYRKLTRIPVPELSEVRISDLLENIKKLYEAELDKKGISLKIEITQQQSEILIDQHLIEQVLINLLTNASHALENTSNPKILLKAYKKDDKTYIQVIDNGSGIPEDKLNKIFIPFFSTKENGSGIGLSLSRNIMNLHGGTLQVYSIEGEGTTFSLIFS